MKGPRLIKAGLWQWITGAGLERFELLQAPPEWILRGTIIALAEEGGAEARYEVVCDESWHTRSADVSVRDGSGQRALRVDVMRGQWHVNGHVNEPLAGCTDIDLEWSPSTNTIPIRRINLSVGENSGPVAAVWVRFPELALQPLSQEYARTSERCYRYTIPGAEFVADITVDEEGLVLTYDGLWRRIDRTTNGRLDES